MRTRAATPHANEFDVWWEARRLRNTMSRRKDVAQLFETWTTQELKLTPLTQLDTQSVARVVQEFVNSDYCVRLCNYRNMEPTDFGQIRGMFELVRLDGNRVTVRLKRVLNERNEALLDRLAVYLRARIRPAAGQRVEVHAVHRDGLDIY